VRRLLFAKMVLCAEQTREKRAMQTQTSHLIFCAQWFENGVNLLVQNYFRRNLSATTGLVVMARLK
jgi:hypothetical protein